MIPMKISVAIIAVIVWLPLFGAVSAVNAQLAVSPSRVVLSSTDRATEIEIRNPSDKPVLVNARTLHGVTRSDSIGRTYRDTVRTGAASERSALEWLRVFPRQ